ncbi:MAG: amino acid ABC transporter permease [Egibacteraceae bacterium]
MTAGPIDLAPLEPIVPPAAEPARRERVQPGEWARRNLFSSPLNASLTVVMAAALGWALAGTASFLFATGEWEIVRVNLTSFMVGLDFPRDEFWRVWIALVLVSAVSGVSAGVSERRRGKATALTERGHRLWPFLLLVAVLLSFTTTLLPAALAVASLAAACGGLAVGRRLPERARRLAPLFWAFGVIGVFVALVGFQGVGWQRWGGLLLTLFLALGGIVLCFPLGVLLALGRRSSLPVVRTVCVGYIELIRGVPLITVLFMASLMLGFFFPPGAIDPALVTRALVAFALFSAAYVAEIVRGGLQGVGKGQVEAAQALGLSPVRTTLLIVLPQGLRNVIPALVGQFISLFKDTSLVAVLGSFDLLRIAQEVVTQPAFLGRGLQTETLLFAAFVYWVCCFTMSKSSQRLERRLGVGQR